MNDGPESQTYTRLRRDSLADSATKQPLPAPPPARKSRLGLAVLAIVALVVIAKLAGLF